MKKLLAQIKLINNGKVVADNNTSYLFKASNYQGDNVNHAPTVGSLYVYQDDTTKKYTIAGPVHQYNLDSIPTSLTYNWVSFDEISDFNGEYPVYSIKEIVTLANGKKAFIYERDDSKDLLLFGDKLSIGQNSYYPLLWDVDLNETYFKLNGKTVKGTNAARITDDFPDIPLPYFAYENGTYSNDCYEFTGGNTALSVGELFPFITNEAHAFLFKAKLKSFLTSTKVGTCGFQLTAIPAGSGMPYRAQKSYTFLFTDDGHIKVYTREGYKTSEKQIELNTLYWFFISFNENFSCCYLFIKEASETDRIEDVTFEGVDPIFVLDGVAEPAGDYTNIYTSFNIYNVLNTEYTVQLQNTAVSSSLNPYLFYFPAGSGEPVKPKITRSDLVLPNRYYISIGSTPSTASITITNTADTTKTITAKGKASLFLNNGESATVTVSLKGYAPVEKTITIDNANYKEIITLEELNLSVVGNVSITAEGLASGFSENDYIVTKEVQ